MAEDTGSRQLINFARTMCKHQQGIPAWCDPPISTGPLDGANTKFKLLKGQAFSYRDKAYFKTKPLGLHRSQHAFVG